MHHPRLAWLPYATSLLLPIATLVFLATAPHGWPGWLAVPGVVALLAYAERVLPSAPAAGTAAPSGAPTMVLLAVGVLHVSNALVLSTVVAGSSLVDAGIAVVLVGIGTAYAGGIVGHELIHRRSRCERSLGRVLLWPALYDHFVVEHLRGHHVHAATPADPTTAHFDETFLRFAARSIPGQLTSAWRLDRASVLTGVVAEVALALTVGAVLGLAALIAWMLQAFVANAIIAAVNYFDHWGLQRDGRRFGEVDAWDSESGLGHYLLLGLPRHVDHHLHPMRPYDRLCPTPASAKLPYGYVRMVLLVVFANSAARRLLRAELFRRGLGPFAACRSTADHSCACAWCTSGACSWSCSSTA